MFATRIAPLIDPRTAILPGFTVVAYSLKMPLFYPYPTC